LITGYTVDECDEFKDIYKDLNDKFKANIIAAIPLLKPGEQIEIDNLPMIQL
jgi:hypothetical protein